MKKVATYLRVSTTEQTVENQRLAIREYASRQGWKIVQEYEDTGVSGATHDRNGLDRLKADAAKSKFSVVAVWKFDRMSRSTQDLLSTLALFQHHGVDFVSVTENIDTTTPAGTMVMTLLGAVAQLELETIRERVNAGLARAKANGVRLGRPRVGFDLQRAIALRNQGQGYKQVAAQLGVARTTLFRYLQAVPQTPSL